MTVFTVSFVPLSQSLVRVTSKSGCFGSLLGTLCPEYPANSPGAGGGGRTLDLCVGNATLYLLSYTCLYGGLHSLSSPCGAPLFVGNLLFKQTSIADQGLRVYAVKLQGIEP